jgi:hypothetical protein
VKRYVRWLVSGLCVGLAGFCSAADFISIPLDCKGLQGSAVGKQRIEAPVSGFSVLPPRGENWCVSSMASGFFFFKHPATVEILAQPPSPHDLFQVVLQTVRFMGLAVAIPTLGTEHPSPDQLKIVVDELINNHFFSQVVGGISSTERRFPTAGVTFRDRPVLWSKLRSLRRESERTRGVPSTARCFHARLGAQGSLGSIGGVIVGNSIFGPQDGVLLNGNTAAEVLDNRIESEEDRADRARRPDRCAEKDSSMPHFSAAFSGALKKGATGCLPAIQKRG